MTKADYIIIGAGIAGASAAYELSKTGKTIVLERETHPGYHTTGRSAAVFETTYKQGDPVIRALVLASEKFLKNPPKGFTDHNILKPRDHLYVAPKEKHAALIEFYEKLKNITKNAKLIKKDEIKSRLPILNDDYGEIAIFLQNELADIDVHALHEGFLKGAKNRNADIVTQAKVTAIRKQGKDWHIETSKGIFSAPIIVNAAGAWVDEIASMAGTSPIGIKPLRRTLILIDPPEKYKDIDDWPMVVDHVESFYFKPDAGKILVCPCDHTLSVPCDAQPEEIDVAYAAHYYTEATGYEVKKIDHKWAGLRNSLDDGYPAVGFSPDVKGFFWLAGQEGYGIKTSPAMARITASMINGDGIPEDIKAFGIDENLLSVSRLFK